MDDLHVEYPTRFSEVCGRKNGGDLFFEKHDNVDELAEQKHIIDIYSYEEEVITFSSSEDAVISF
jgi:hypothetical protein